MSDLESAYIRYLNGQITQPAPDDGKPHLWGQKGFQFHDLLDAINPLQHLPVISTVYRWITGESIGNIPRIVGDAIYGGIPGFVSGLLNVLVKEETGKDVGENVVATLFGDSKSTTPSVPAQNANQPELTTEQAAALTHAPVDATELAPLASVATAPAAQSPTSASAAAAAPWQTASTATAAATPTATPAGTASTPVLPDHPPIPLARGFGMSMGASAGPQSPITVSKDAAASAFLQQAAERQRQLLGASAAPAQNGRVLSTRVVPLQLPPGSLPIATASALPAVTPAAGSPPSSGPVDISQKMLDALDKYMALQKQPAAARGGQVDVNP